MQKIKVLLITVIVLTFLSACSSMTSSSSDSAMRSRLDPKFIQKSRLLIRSAELSIDVEEPKITVSEIEAIVSRESGYVENIYDRDQKRISMTVKIPVKSLDLFIEKIFSMGDLISKSLHVRDVTEDVIDIEARLTNLKILRDRFRKLLDKAKDVSDVLKIEKELSRIQTEIDSIEARRKSLKDQIALSRVEINLTQKKIYGPLGYLGKGLYWFVKKLFVIK